MDEKISQSDLIFEYYKKNPKKEIMHPEVVDWATKEYLKRTGKILRDPDRAIRTLHEKGFLIKITDGIYSYEPGAVEEKMLENFTQAQKKKILKRDGYKCVLCGKGKKEGVKLHVDHIKPKYLGGKAEVENGQTLCAQHNFIKKTLNQTETGKKMFIRLYELSKSEKNKDLLKFCREILETYEKHDINCHIDWEK